MRKLTVEEKQQIRDGVFRPAVKEANCWSCPMCRAALVVKKDAFAEGFGCETDIFDNREGFLHMLRGRGADAWAATMEYVGAAGPVWLFKCPKCGEVSVRQVGN
jgi:predicted nucleic-acid-binding Zn-ribbon protein